MNMKAEKRIEQLLLAAAACFARRGFHRTTMDDIAREAGVSAGLIYRHFASKDELIIAIVEEYEMVTRERLAQSANEEGRLSQSIEALFAASGVDERTEAVLMVEIIAEALRNPSIAAVLRQNDEQIAARLTQLIAAAQARGEADASLAPAAATELLLALRDGLTLRTSLASTADLARGEELTTALHVLCKRFLGY
jgi:TetR/AcrR family transcriptional regulator, repressor for uid operon